MSIEEAEQIATDLLTKAALTQNGDGSDIEDDVKGASRGNTAIAATAADQLEKVNGEPETRDVISDPVEPNVLAISRDDGESPLLMLVQTVPASGPPELYVMSSPSTPDNFRIVWWAPMLPGTDIGAFDRRSAGSPIVRKGKGDLPQSPKQLFSALADYIDYPEREVLRVKTNGYAPQVRKAAKGQASAVTFAALKRESDFDVRSGMELTPPDEFLVFDDDDSITRRARLNSYIYVAMTIPLDDQRSEMIAAGEQLVSAVGS